MNELFETGRGDPRPILQQKFLVPPFSVLDTKQGYWQERKRLWLSLGIEGESGRSITSQSNNSLSSRWDRKNDTDTGNKIMGAVDNKKSTPFDPVLCELMYKWFCIDKGKILDPFAGGSVRGIVAAILGYDYTGIDLRDEQIAANEKQAGEILKADVDIKISSASLRQLFHPCDLDFIKNECNATCCEQSTGDTLITVHPLERGNFEDWELNGNFLESVNGKCLYKDNNLCGLHGTDKKPFGCIVSPFTLNSNNTLIVRNRYRLFKCYKVTEGKIPVYEAHRHSLVRLFGEEKTTEIINHLDNGGGDITVKMDYKTHKILRDNDRIKKDETIKDNPSWLKGDALNLDNLVTDKTDLIFTCPPYFDLEQYSNVPADLSNMGWDKFLEAYNTIIDKSLALLKNNRFAVFVVGDIRDKKGMYRNLPAETITAFTKNRGVSLYNEMILVNVVGSLPIRINKQFSSYRKCGKMHQNILVFFKGDPKTIKDNYGEVESETSI